jgi:hypothetical protein
LLSAAILSIGAGAAYAGPLLLMGIDAEDGGPGGHGPITVYQSVVNNGVLANVTNGGSGILVVGGGKSAFDNVTAFWNQIDSATPGSVTYVNGAANIASRSFAGFAMIAVVSSQFQTFSGGLTQSENTALASRQSDIAAFVNAGGGLMGLSQEGLTPQYGYLPNGDQFTFANPGQFDNINATADGNAIGINDSLDVCCWHDEYLTFPSFLAVLATNALTGHAVALGGAAIIVPDNTPPVAVNDNYGVIGGATLTVPTPGVLANDTDADHDPLTAQLVTGPSSGTLVLNANGSFTYVPGEDTVGVVTFTYQAFDGTDRSNVATVRITVTAGCEGIRATLVGTPGDDRLVGTSGIDVIVGRGGADDINGRSGNDRICGGSGDDELNGDPGNDRLHGDSGADDLKADDGDDVAYGEAGADRLRGDDGKDTLFGGSGNDIVEGDDDNDRLFGEAGVDRLFGGGDADALDGGADTPDRCDGESGTDTATASCEQKIDIP